MNKYALSNINEASFSISEIHLQSNLKNKSFSILYHLSNTSELYFLRFFFIHNRNWIFFSHTKHVNDLENCFHLVTSFFSQTQFFNDICGILLKCSWEMLQIEQKVKLWSQILKSNKKLCQSHSLTSTD